MALNWNIFVPGRSKKDVKAECAIRLNDDSKGKDNNKKVVVFRFYNDSFNKFNKGSDYVTFTWNNNHTRIYFANAKCKNGFKLSALPKYKSIRYRFDKVQEAVWEMWVGDYNIVFDSEEQFYYIDINSKI